MKIVKALLGCLFGLPFALAGIFIANETAVPTYTEWQRMQNWQPARAELLSLSGGENFTKAEYRYQINSQSFINDRVYVTQFNDNIGSYHPSLYARLNRARANGQSIDIWVNPANPNQAVIDKSMRWGLFALMTIFCSVFILIGFVVCYVSLTGKSNASAEKQRQMRKLQRSWQRHNDRSREKLSFEEFVTKNASQESAQILGSALTTGDWQQRKGWKSNRIRSGAKWSVVGAWLISIFVIGISSPLVLQFPDEWDKGNYAILIGLIFPLLGLYLFCRAAIATLEYFRFGVVEFVMDPYPGAIGGHVGGTIELKRLQYGDPQISSATFNVLLECVYSYVSGSGKNRSRREDIRWAERGSAQVRRSAHGIQLAFCFDVPDHLPEASEPRGGEYYFWRLKVDAELPGADLSRHYDIPVFKTGAQSSSVKHSISAQVSEQKQQESQTKAAAIQRGEFHLTDLSRSVRVQQLGSELRLYYPMFRNKGLTLFAAIFSVGFSFAVYGINTSFGGGGLFSIFTALFSIPFALVALFASIAVIYLPFNNLTVEISGGSLNSVRRLLVFPVSSNRVSASEITELSIRRSGSTGQGVNKVEHYKVFAHSTNGKKITVAEDVDGEDLATHFKDFIAARLGKA